MLLIRTFDFAIYFPTCLRSSSSFLLSVQNLSAKTILSQKLWSSSLPMSTYFNNILTYLVISSLDFQCYCRLLVVTAVCFTSKKNQYCIFHLCITVDAESTFCPCLLMFLEIVRNSHRRCSVRNGFIRNFS